MGTAPTHGALSIRGREADDPDRQHLPLSHVPAEAVSDGRDAYLALLAQPEAAAARVERSSDALQLWTLTLLRYEHVMYHVCVFRWVPMIAAAYDYKVPGLFEYMPLLQSIVPDDEEYRPHAQKLPDGEHLIEGLYPPPEPSSIIHTSEELTLGS